jgi:predicted nucleotide-binding protein (sugar kinase/HSP70/actin superfamily)
MNQLIILTTLFICSFYSGTEIKTSDKMKSPIEISENQFKKDDFNDGEAAKKWLLKAIDQFFKETVEMDNITTKTYSEYKSDAMNIEMDGGMTLAAFEKKWNGKFNTKRVGYDGFLISAQDWNKISVTSCLLMNTTKDNGFLFRVVLKDVVSKEIFKRDIKVIPSGKSFLIADVLE